MFSQEKMRNQQQYNLITHIGSNFAAITSAPNFQQQKTKPLKGTPERLACTCLIIHRLDIELKLDHVTIDHDVIFTFLADLALCSGLGH